MLFVKKFCSHIKCYNITRDMPDLIFRSVYLFNMNPANVCLFKANNYNKEIPLKLIINTLERRHGHCSSVFNLNLEQFSNLILVL